MLLIRRAGRVSDFAHVPRLGLSPSLPLDFATPDTQPARLRSGLKRQKQPEFFSLTCIRLGISDRYGFTELELATLAACFAYTTVAGCGRHLVERSQGGGSDAVRAGGHERNQMPGAHGGL